MCQPINTGDTNIGEEEVVGSNPHRRVHICYYGDSLEIESVL